MAWDEWEPIKAEAVQRQSAHTRLNQLPAEAGGGSDSGDLVVHDDELGKLGNLAYDLLTQLSTDGDVARPSTFTASNSLFNDGLDMGAALLEVHDGWNTQLRTLKEACAHISNHLDFSRAGTRTAASSPRSPPARRPGTARTSTSPRGAAEPQRVPGERDAQPLARDDGNSTANRIAGKHE
ncbi:hypothetical protein ACIQFU_01035 [Streptomyces sp. NPDC093065]|uniref:hypothetical protein n=1 Tax=Streptomyces sp. NPDC093065 TaxID=3366021 RepID=UPI003818C661